MQKRMRHDTHFVEELAQRHGEPIGRLLPMGAIEPDPHQPRSSMGDMDDLVASIRDKGVLEPILVRPIDGSGMAGEPSHRIISGERRYHAAEAAGLLEVPVIEMDVGEEEALEIALVENLQRKDLTPFEEAEGYQRLSDRHGYSHEQIAEAVGKSRTVVTEALSLLRMPPRARNAVQALGIQSRSTVLEVLKAARDEDEMIGLLEQVAQSGLNRDDIRARSRARSGPGRRRRKPYVFKFRAPDRTYSLALSFRKSTVDKTDLITALEQILKDLRTAPEDG
jgi:ParB family chromosome partitioning protein